jgi:hypothetical protein
MEFLKKLILSRLARKLISIAIGALFMFLSRKFGLSFDEVDTKEAVDLTIAFGSAFAADTLAKWWQERKKTPPPAPAPVPAPGTQAASEIKTLEDAASVLRGPQP